MNLNCYLSKQSIDNINSKIPKNLYSDLVKILK